MVDCSVNDKQLECGDTREVPLESHHHVTNVTSLGGSKQVVLLLLLLLFHGRRHGQEAAELLGRSVALATTTGGICLGARGSALSTRGIALSAGRNASATFASSKGRVLGLAARSHAVGARRTKVEVTVASRRGRESCVVRLTAETDSVARTDMAARGGGSGSVVTLVSQSLVGTDRAALLLHCGAVALTVEVVREARLANILEVGRRYDELVMRIQCMKRWKMLTVPINGAGVT